MHGLEDNLWYGRWRDKESADTRANVLGCPKSFFPFILFCRITCDRFSSVEINTATFYRLGFTFVRRCSVVRNTFAEERHLSDDLIYIDEDPGNRLLNKSKTILI